MDRSSLSRSSPLLVSNHRENWYEDTDTPSARILCGRSSSATCTSASVAICVGNRLRLVWLLVDIGGCSLPTNLISPTAGSSNSRFVSCTRSSGGGSYCGSWSRGTNTGGISKGVPLQTGHGLRTGRPAQFPLRKRSW